MGGRYASQASVLPLGFCPVPAVVRPSAEIAAAEVNIQPLRAAPTLGISTSLSFRMPLPASQMKASNPIVEELLPTTADPSAETAFAALAIDPPARSPKPTIPPP